MSELKMYEVSRNGECSRCKNQAEEAEVIKCYECQTIFHAICGEETPFCARTNLGNFKKLKANFVFICDPCLTRKEESQASELKDQITRLTATVASLAEEFKSFKTVQSAPEETPPTPWTNKDRVDKMKSSLCIKSNNGAPVDMAKVQELATTHCIQVSTTNVKENGDVFVVLPSDENRQKLIPLLEENDFDQNEIIQVKEKLPTVTILGVRDYTTKEEFVEKVKKQNPRLKDKLEQESAFKIVYSKKPRDNAPEGKNGFQVVVRVSEEVRKIIKDSNDRIYVDLESYKVVDRFYIKRCNNCQQFGHYEKDCTSESHCGYCGNNGHKSSECNQVEEGDLANYKCTNCENAGKNANGHSAHWHKCPSLLDLQKKAKKGIPYYNRKNF
jgi:hypothetical protein